MKLQRKAINSMRTKLLILTNDECKKTISTTYTKINSISAIDLQKKCNDIVINLGEQFYKPDSVTKFTFYSKTNLINIKKINSLVNNSASNTPKATKVSEQVFQDFLTTLHTKSSLAQKKIQYFENKYITNRKEVNESLKQNNLMYNNIIKSPKIIFKKENSFDCILNLTHENRRKLTNGTIKIENILEYINRDKDFMKDKKTKLRVRKGFQYLRGLGAKLKLNEENKQKSDNVVLQRKERTHFLKMTEILMLKENIDIDLNMKRSKSLSRGFKLELPKVIKKNKTNSKIFMVNFFTNTHSEEKNNSIVIPKSKISFSNPNFIKEEKVKEFSLREKELAEEENREENNRSLKEKLLQINIISSEFSGSNKNERSEEKLISRENLKKQAIRFSVLDEVFISKNNKEHSSVSLFSHKIIDSISYESSEKSESILSSITLSEVSNSRISQCSNALITLSSQESLNESTKRKKNNILFEKKKKLRNLLLEIE